jgi:hypothetical protein
MAGGTGEGNQTGGNMIELKTFTSRNETSEELERLGIEPKVIHGKTLVSIRMDCIESFYATTYDFDGEQIPATCIQMMSGDAIVVDIPYDLFVNKYNKGQL